MPDLPRGLYEALITEALEAQLRELGERLRERRRPLHEAEAADRIALHVSRVVQRGLTYLTDERRVAEGIGLARKIIALIDESVAGSDLKTELPTPDGALLDALLALRPDGEPEELAPPSTPLLDTTLLTNAPNEPHIGFQVLSEIPSADRIDLVMAFVRRSGISPLMPALRRHRDAGRPLRVLTTIYTGTTEERALEELAAIGADVRVSYDTRGTRLHAKAWLFHRGTGFSTAFIGSSNLTHTAQVTGLEWNVRISGARNPDVIRQIEAVFESYRNNADFVPYDREEFRRHAQTTPASADVMLSPVEIRLEPFQARLLELIELSRQMGHHRNLLVAATGTGKTVMAAVDYARLGTHRPRLLFVAHRHEILDQSIRTFRHALRDGSFGEMWVGGARPTHFEHVFASIQSLTANGLAALDPRHFEVVIVDEFHHAEADSYRALLNHLQPAELLGLTATPERTDGLPVLEWFDNRIAAELRVWDAIDQQHLAPFAYFGVHDQMDLREIPWVRGRGYDAEGLTNLLTANDAWARQVIARVQERVDSVAGMRALGFCVTVQHARYMARVFNDAGIASVAIWADTPKLDRQSALNDLAAGRIKALFSVDLFNEGVDLPVVDTLLMLRPTDSPTLFLQQLGRGLRRAHGKTVCTVLDFVGHHRKEFRFDLKLRALLGGSRKELEKRVEEGFPYLPAGCHMELDSVARDIVLKSIRESLPNRWSEKAAELRALAAANPQVSLSSFLHETGLDLDDVYGEGPGNGRSWTELKEAAGLSVLTPGPHETELRRACGRLRHIDDFERIRSYRQFLAMDQPPDPGSLPPYERRLLRMLVASVLTETAQRDWDLARGCTELWHHPQIRREISELLDVVGTRISHVGAALSTHPDVPVRVHARYTRTEIMAAFVDADRATAKPWREGVHWAKDAKADLFAFTLDKTTGHFSPTTRYRDYAISRDLMHWESQSTTSAASPTGSRYQNHVALGTSVLLFARHRTDDRAFWFLGPATYVSHDGDRPMAVTWRLQHPLPGDLYESFAAAVA